MPRLKPTMIKTDMVYFTSKKAKEELGIAQSSLIFIENELELIIQKKRKRLGRSERIYTIADIDRFKLIIQAKELGVPISTIKMYGIDRLPEIVEFFTKLSEKNN